MRISSQQLLKYGTHRLRYCYDPPVDQRLNGRGAWRGVSGVVNRDLRIVSVVDFVEATSLDNSDGNCRVRSQPMRHGES